MSRTQTPPAPHEPFRTAPAEPETPAREAGMVFTNPLHSGLHVGRFYGMHMMGAIFPLTAGLLLYGWRGMAVLGAVVGAAALAVVVWRRVGARGAQVRYEHALWLALLLGLMLPAHLASGVDFVGDEAFVLWPLLPAAGLALVMLIWLLGGLGSGRVHPVLLAYLLLASLFHHDMVPHWVLQRAHLFTGDPLDVQLDESPAAAPERWLSAPPVPGQQGTWAEPASQRLVFYTSGIESPEGAFGAWITLDGLLRDRMPPLEDLIIGGHPGPVGLSSAIAVLIGGLFLVYRGLIDFRVPLLICLSAFAALLVLPVPVVITEAGAEWRWIAGTQPGVGWATAITFANYQLMAGPLLFTAFFLATSPAIRPMTRRGRAIYAVLIGVFAAGFQLYATVSFGPYLALLGVSLLTPLLDRRFRPRALV